ncbi:MAG: hypothetical protein AAB690_00930 [Patescibacteria group bacterium]
MKSPEFSPKPFNPENEERERVILDISLGQITFSEADRKRMREEGLTDEQIEEKLALANDNLAKAQIRAEINKIRKPSQEEEEDLAA